MAMRGSALAVYRDDRPVAMDYMSKGIVSGPKRVFRRAERRSELVRRRQLIWYMLAVRHGLGVMEIARLWGYTHGVVSRGVKAGERIARGMADGD